MVVQIPERRWRLGLGVIVLLALAVRIAVALTVPEIAGPDAGRYHGAALDLVEGRGFRVTDSGPLYPAFLAAIYTVFGPGNVRAVQAVQCLGWAAAVGLIGLIGRRLFDPMTGWLAAGFAALYPPFIKYKFFGGSTYYATENLFAWLLLAGVWWLVAEEELGWRHAIGAGVALGLATLTRPTVLLIPAVVAAWGLLRHPLAIRHWAVSLIAFTVAMWLVIDPWALRNAQVYGAFVPVAPMTGLPLFGGNNLYSGGDWVDASDAPEYRGLRQITDPVEQDRAYVRTAVEFWRGLTPAQHLKRLVKKLFLFWTDFGGSYNAAYGFMVPWAFVGMWAVWSNHRARLLTLLVAYTLGICLIVYATERMRFPIEPYLILLASAGVMWFVRRFQRRMIPCAVLAGWAALDISLIWLWPLLSRAINFV